MPPKKKVEVEEEPAVLLPPRLTAADIQATWDDTSPGEYFARVLVEEIVGEMEHEIVRAHMDHTAVPWTVQSVVTDLMESLHLNFIEREEMEASPLDLADVQTSIEEPLTTDPDSWARASILQRSALVKPDSDQFVKVSAGRRANSNAVNSNPTVDPKRIGSADASGPASPISGVNASSFAGASTSSNNPLSGLARMGTLGPGGLNTSSHAQQKRRSVADGRQLSHRSSHSHQSLQDEIFHTAEEEKLLERQRKAAERMAYLRGVSDRLNKQFHDIRNNTNPIVVDGASNQVLIVNKPDPKRLPSVVEPKVAVEGNGENSAPVSPRGRAGARASTPGVNTSYRPPNAKPPKSKKPDPNSFWEPEQATNPMIAGVTPSPGVASKEGDTVKRAEMKGQKSKISKGEYVKLVNTQHSLRQAVELDGGALQPAPTTTKEGALHPGAAPASRTSTLLGVPQEGSGQTRKPSHTAEIDGGATTKQKEQPKSVDAPLVRPKRRKSVADDQSQHDAKGEKQKLPERTVVRERVPTPSRAGRSDPTRARRKAEEEPVVVTRRDILERARATTPTTEAVRKVYHSRPVSRQSKSVLHMADSSMVDDDITRDFLHSVELPDGSPTSQSGSYGF